MFQTTNQVPTEVGTAKKKRLTLAVFGFALLVAGTSHSLQGLFNGKGWKQSLVPKQ